MLTDRQKEIVKSTVPLLETGGEALTTHFYKTMLGEYPEVRPLFNQAHQQSGAQPRALAHSVLMYAKHIDKLENLGDLPAQIVNKHVALQVQPEHYPIVGTCLLRAIREVLGAEIATDEVIAAWGAAYQQLADILIAAERGNQDGGRHKIPSATPSNTNAGKANMLAVPQRAPPRGGGAEAGLRCKVLRPGCWQCWRYRHLCESVAHCGFVVCPLGPVQSQNSIAAAAEGVERPCQRP